MFDDKPNKSYDRFVLRNGSFDFNRAQMRDAVLHKLLLEGNADIDVLDYQPVVVFLNGEFYGIEDVREKVDRFYLKNNYQDVDINNIDLLKEDTVAVNGDFTNFNAMYDFVVNNNMAQKSNYDSAQKLIDIHSLCDYFIAETALNNSDWPENNIKYWRKRDAGAKWRYILFDLDGCLGNPWESYDRDQFGIIMDTAVVNKVKHVQILKALFKNPDFKKYFINRYADLMNTLFTPSNMIPFVRANQQLLAGSMPEHCVRWGYTMQAWEKEIDSVIVPYIENRPAYARNYVQKYFNLNKQLAVKLKTHPEGAGTITINSLDHLLCPWEGVYFDGNAIRLMANAGRGYVFKEWRSDRSNVSGDFSNAIELNVDTNETFTAYFVEAGNGMQLTVFPSPAKDFVKLSFISGVSGLYSVTITGSDGRLLKQVNEIILKEGFNTSEIDITKLSSGTYFLKVKTIAGGAVEKLVVVKQ